MSAEPHIRSPFSERLAPQSRVEMLSELVPRAKVLALLVNPSNAIADPMIRNVQEAARAKGLQLQILKASTESEIDAAYGCFARARIACGFAAVVGTDLLIRSINHVGYIIANPLQNPYRL